jgi:hypothetical protein
MPTLTRHALYDLVWSMPMTKLAESLGLSDVGLAKICDRHRVPTPPRGYWAKKEAGKKVRQAIFVEVDDPLLDRIEITSTRSALPEPVRRVVEQRRAERKSVAQSPRSATQAPPDPGPVQDPHPMVRATAATLRRGKPSDSSVVKAIGPGLCGITVGVKTVERVIFIIDSLARACDVRGIKLSPAETRLSAAIEDDSVTFEIKEKTKQVPHVLTKVEVAAEEKRRKRTERWAQGRNAWDDVDFFAPYPPKFDTVRTGELGLEVHGWGDGLRRSWRDGKTQTLESLIDEIVDGLEVHLATARLRREEQNRAAAAYRELERRRGLAKARGNRERSRKALLMKLIRTERQADQLRKWIASKKPILAETSDPDLSRMIQWADDELAALEAFIDSGNLISYLRANNLFPQIDDLHDPFGEPPPEKRWYD